MNPKHEWFKISKRRIYILFLYLLALLIASSILLFLDIYQFIPCSDFLFQKSLLAGIESSILGASIFYIRKLYKACINLDILHPQTPEDEIRQIGIFFYFFLRPFFAACFSIISLIILKSGIELLADSISLKKNFYYSSIMVSFIIGYSCGDFVDKLEDIGKSMVNKIKLP